MNKNTLSIIFQFYMKLPLSQQLKQSINISILYTFKLKQKQEMQVQKHLFRIAEKSNKADGASACWKSIFIISLIFGLIIMSAFVIGELFVKDGLHQLQTCFSSHDFVLKADQVGLIYKDGMAETIIGQNKPIDEGKNQYCDIYKNLNTTSIKDDVQLVLSGMIGVYRMEDKNKQLLKFDNYTFVLKNRPGFRDFAYSSSLLFGIEIIQLGDSQNLHKITASKEVFVKSPTIRFSYRVQRTESSSILSRIFGILQIIVTYAIASIITSLYIYITIIASPAVILIFLQLTPYGRTQGFFEAFKAFPWIGMHSLIFRSSTQSDVRGAFTSVCASLIVYFIIMYLGYYTIVVQISNMFFDQPMDSGVGEILFGYFAIVQFAALVFMRTRPFIKYFPVINMLFIFFFMLYCKFSPLGFKLHAVVAMQFFGVALFSYMVLTLEIDAQRIWQPDSGYTPNIKQPRAGLLSAFNLNWINALPDEWTMLMPLMSRDHFSNKEMAFVQQSYQTLGQYLNQH